MCINYNEEMGVPLDHDDDVIRFHDGIHKLALYWCLLYS